VTAAFCTHTRLALRCTLPAQDATTRHHYPRPTHPCLHYRHYWCTHLHYHPPLLHFGGQRCTFTTAHYVWFAARGTALHLHYRYGLVSSAFYALLRSHGVRRAHTHMVRALPLTRPPPCLHINQDPLSGLSISASQPLRPLAKAWRRCRRRDNGCAMPLSRAAPHCMYCTIAHYTCYPAHAYLPHPPPTPTTPPAYTRTCRPHYTLPLRGTPRATYTTTATLRLCVGLGWRAYTTTLPYAVAAILGRCCAVA